MKRKKKMLEVMIVVGMKRSTLPLPNDATKMSKNQIKITTTTMENIQQKRNKQSTSITGNSIHYIIEKYKKTI